MSQRRMVGLIFFMIALNALALMMLSGCNRQSGLGVATDPPQATSSASMLYVQPVAAGKPAHHPFYAPPLGLYLRDLTNDELKQRRLPYGVLVEGALGLAGSAGVQADDVILAVNETATPNIPRFWEAVEFADWKITLVIKRGDKVITIDLDNTDVSLRK